MGLWPTVLVPERCMCSSCDRSFCTVASIVSGGGTALCVATAPPPKVACSCGTLSMLRSFQKQAQAGAGGA